MSVPIRAFFELAQPKQPLFYFRSDQIESNACGWSEYTFQSYQKHFLPILVSYLLVSNVSYWNSEGELKLQTRSCSLVRFRKWLQSPAGSAGDSRSKTGQNYSSHSQSLDYCRRHFNCLGSVYKSKETSNKQHRSSSLPKKSWWPSYRTTDLSKSAWWTRRHHSLQTPSQRTVNWWRLSKATKVMSRSPNTSANATIVLMLVIADCCSCNATKLPSRRLLCHRRTSSQLIIADGLTKPSPLETFSGEFEV